MSDERGGILDYLFNRGAPVLSRFFWVVELVEFLEVGRVGFVKVLFDVCEVHYVPVLVVFVGAVDTRQRLEQVVVFEFSTEVQTFESGCVEPGEKHVEDDQDVYGVVLLEVFDDLLLGVFVIAVE